MPPPPARAIDAWGATVHVAAEHPATLPWLDEFFPPAAWHPAAGQPELATVAVCPPAAPAAATAAPAGAVSTFSLDGGFEELFDGGRDGTWRVLADARGTRYRLDAATRRVELQPSRRPEAAHVPLLRTVRELVSLRAFEAGEILLHAGLLAAGEHGLLLSGPKGAGKTSLLLLLMRAPGVALVSNDRVFVRPVARHSGGPAGGPAASPAGSRAGGPAGSSGGGSAWGSSGSAAGSAGAGVCATGIPTLFTVKAAARARFPLLCEALAPAAGGGAAAAADLVLSPAAVADRLGVATRARAAATTLVFVAQHAAADAIAVRRLPAAEAAQRLYTDGLFRTVHPPAVPAAWRDFDRWRMPTDAALRAACTALAATLRVVECAVGANLLTRATPDDAARVLGRAMAEQ